MSDEAKHASAEFFSDLMQNEQRWATVPVDAWGRTVRLEKLDGPTKMRLIDILNASEQNDDGTFANQADAIAFAIEVIAVSVVDETGAKPFDNQAGREFLGRAELEAITVLIDAANDLNGLAGVQVSLEAVKKKSPADGGKSRPNTVSRRGARTPT